MFIKIPFESEIKFKTNISEITKMSLEHDFNISDDKVLGNFYISGEYKIHSISINKDTFNYTLPFTVELREDIDTDTIEFNIEDFSYDIINNDTLKVNIEYSLKAEEKEKIASDSLDDNVNFVRVNEDELTSELAYIDDFLDKEDEDIPNNSKENSDELEERDIQSEEKTIINSVQDSDDTFVTYHIHIIKENETLDSIALMYNYPKSLLEEYNQDNTFNIGDKLLIPKLDE